MTAEQLLIEVHGERYALFVDGVVEVLRTTTVAPVPGGPPALLGLHNQRGQALPILDLAALLRLAPAARRPYAVVVEAGGGRAGLAVDGVIDVVSLPRSTASADSDGPLMGSVVSDDALVGLLDVAALLDRALGGPE